MALVTRIAALSLLALLVGCADGGGSFGTGDAGIAGTGTASTDSTAPPDAVRPADDATPDAGADGTGAGDGGDAALGGPDPAPAPSADAAESDGSFADAGGAASSTGPSPTEPPPADPGPAPQPGVLTAGDHDDQLNPGRYRDYATRHLQSAGDSPGLPFVDLTNRVTIAVTDADGAPFSGARVDASNGDLPFDRLVTPADGTVHLYPALLDLPGDFLLSVRDRLGDVTESVRVRIDELDASRRVEVRLPALNVPATALDLALVIDTTGSMGDELEYLKAELGSIVGRIADASPGLDLRVGIVAYRDDGDAYVVRAADFDTVGAARDSLGNERADGGGDYPEAMDRAMDAMLDLGWRADAAKVALLVADAPPHADRAGRTFDAALRARSRMIHVVPVAASGVAAEAQYLMRAMAAVTQGRYLFLTDDSGVGLPHEEPDIACYLVTRLDGLIVRTVRSLVEGVRVEPSEAEILRRVGDYDAGRCLADGQ